MIKGLFLDDERQPSDVSWINYPDNIDWYVVKTYAEFQEQINTDQYEVISLDHDIQDYFLGKEMTGKDCIGHLVNYCLDGDIDPNLITVFVHSQNPTGKRNIESFWDCFKEYYRGSTCRST